MRLLPIAVENKRWDLAAHTLVLATASLLNNGDKPDARKRALNNPLLGISVHSATDKVTRTRAREIEREKRCPSG